MRNEGKAQFLLKKSTTKCATLAMRNSVSIKDLIKNKTKEIISLMKVQKLQIKLTSLAYVQIVLVKLKLENIRSVK